MPKRSYDAAAAMPSSGTERVPPMKAQKTERSHEENQERAYIAASRRADRSLEARVQSAKMASEIHRRRTGRGLKVSEEIVVKEEMYEEEEDDLPRPYRYLTAHLQTNSPDMNNRVNAYITTQAAMATMARYNEINRLFSESFPTAMTYRQQADQSMYTSPLTNTGSFSPTQAAASPNQAPAHSRTQSMSQADRRDSSTTNCTSPTVGTVSSPPGLTPSSVTADTPDSRSTPYLTPNQAFPPLDHQLAQPQQASIFTSELPNEVKMMANIDMSDPMAPHFFGGHHPSEFQPFFPQFTAKDGELKTDDVGLDLTSELPSSSQDTIQADDTQFISPLNQHLSIAPETYSRLGSPGMGMGGDGWESFVDFGTEQ